MRYLRTALACAVAGAAFAMTPASAETIYANGPSGAHYASGEAEPVCSQTNPLGMACTDSVIGGIGNMNATLNFTVTYSATVTCTNKGTQLVEVKTQFPKSGTLTLRPTAKNGQIAVPAVASTAPSANDFTGAAVCPNRNWSKEVAPNSLAIDGFLYTLTFAAFTDPFISLP